jgi:outer membrane protein OmpU
MNNLKKIGLTALAASLVATSAFAGAMSVSGGASIGVKNTTGSNDSSTGKSFTMGNQLDFAGSGELDNGLTVSLAMTIDQADNTSVSDGPFDSHSLTISSDALGTFVFSGEGGSSAQGAMDAGADGNIYDNGTGVADITGASAGDNSMFYTLPEVMDGVAITASMSPGRAAQETHTSYGLKYTGVDGLMVQYGTGDSGAPAAEIESTTMSASYAFSSFSLAASNTEATKVGAANREVQAYKVTYTVSDDISVHYAEATYETVGSATDEEIESYGASYTSGGMTLSATTYATAGAANVAGAKTDRWSLGLSFAF